jgi:polyhydroxyalkanoate synthase
MAASSPDPLAVFQDPSTVPVGQTPRTLVATAGPAQLYWYPARVTLAAAVPALLVPHLGLRPSYIYDLCPGASFIEGMVCAGMPLHFLDWGTPRSDDAAFGIAEAVLDVLPALVTALQEHAGTDVFNLVAYSSGVPLATSYVATHPGAPVTALLLLAGPLDFAHGALSSLGQSPATVPLRSLLTTPVRTGWPTGPVPSLANLWWTLLTEQRRLALVEGQPGHPSADRGTETPATAAEVPPRRALYRWLNDWLGWPAAFGDQWIHWLQQENRLARGTLTLRGHPVDLGAVTPPVLAVAAKADTIVPPAAVHALLDLVSSAERNYEETPGGHLWPLVAPHARAALWPTLTAWLRAHP